MTDQPPIPMILHCPRCGFQHVDKPEPEKGWDNPPHRSHLCGGCGCIWRPATVATIGVASLEPIGSSDTWVPGDPSLHHMLLQAAPLILPEASASAPIGEKAAHVRAAGQSRRHGCHWPGCPEQVPPARWGCRAHWYRLPQAIRTRIWRAYRVGQEEDGRPSAEYVAAARAAQDWIAQQQGADLFAGGGRQ